jgi:hypothetical protein
MPTFPFDMIKATSALILELNGDEGDAYVLGARRLVEFHTIDVVSGGHASELYKDIL